MCLDALRNNSPRKQVILDLFSVVWVVGLFMALCLHCCCCLCFSPAGSLLVLQPPATVRARQQHSSILDYIHTAVGTEPSGFYSIWPFPRPFYQIKGFFRLGSQSSSRFIIVLLVPCHHLVVTPPDTATRGEASPACWEPRCCWGCTVQLHRWGDAGESTLLMKHKTQQIN